MEECCVKKSFSFRIAIGVAIATLTVGAISLASTVATFADGGSAWSWP